MKNIVFLFCFGKKCVTIQETGNNIPLDLRMHEIYGGLDFCSKQKHVHKVIQEKTDKKLEIVTRKHKKNWKKIYVASANSTFIN